MSEAATETIDEAPAGGPPPDESKGAPDEAAKGKPPATTAAGSDPEPKPGAASWPEDWRQKLAGGDPQLLARLQRFGQLGDVVKSWREAEKKISSGAVVDAATPYPEKGTPEEQAAWRELHKVPESWDKYDLNLGEGLVLGEDDKPVIDSFLQDMHKANLPAPVVKQVLTWYAKFQDDVIQKQYEGDSQASESAIQALRDEWGPEYRANMNAIKGMLDAVSPELAGQLFHARGPDGQLLGNNPTILQWLATTAKTLNPAATLIPGDTTTSLLAIDDEISKIEKLMSNRASEYWKGPNSERMQARYRDLVTARQRMQK